MTPADAGVEEPILRRISGVNISTDCNYITFRLDKYDEKTFVKLLLEDIEENGINCEDLVPQSETPVNDKFDVYLPSSLLRKAYAVNKLEKREVIERIKELYKQFE